MYSIGELIKAACLPLLLVKKEMTREIGKLFMLRLFTQNEEIMAFKKEIRHYQ